MVRKYHATWRACERDGVAGASERPVVDENAADSDATMLCDDDEVDRSPQTPRSETVGPWSETVAEREFRGSQARRRMQTSGMLGVVGVALLIGHFVDQPAWLVLCYWGSVLVVVVWMAALAMADVWATREHFNRLQYEHFLQQQKLKAELHRLRAAERTDRIDSSSPADGRTPH